jgi:hypothetical protein
LRIVSSFSTRTLSLMRAAMPCASVEAIRA